ncbi:hypothetical protein [Asticcacaulis benevestitus]|uniref:hypothetical protein n=1 Tax=Asticcacaulis benevestitus TaxID=347481 RepID=UPI0012FC474E|nr:hypothetical protein [Asticcacaulis benevestitus]
MADLINGQAFVREEDFTGFLDFLWIRRRQVASLFFYRVRESLLRAARKRNLSAHDSFDPKCAACVANCDTVPNSVVWRDKRRYTG